MNSFEYDVVRDCRLLSEDKSFENLYKLICAHSDMEAAVWLENDTVKSYTFSELASMADNYAAFFREKLGTTGRVCISLDSCKEWFPIFWGLVRSGHDIMALDASMKDEKAGPMLEETGCIATIGARKRNIDPKYIQILVGELSDLPGVRDYKPLWGSNIALCTSGTTSDSRIFIYNEESICFLALYSEKVLLENRRLIDNCAFRTIAFLPFHHVLGFAGIFIWSHFLGYTTIYLKDRSPVTITKTMQLCHATQIVAVPLLANSIARSLKAEVAKKGVLAKAVFGAGISLSIAVQRIAPEFGLKLASSLFKGIQEKLFGTHMRSIVLGGSHTDFESLRILNGIGYFTTCGFGTTETAITSFETSMSLGNRLRGSIGLPMMYTEYRIKPIEGKSAVKKGESVGELQIRSKGIHDGRVVEGKFLPADTDTDGWFSTGDIARYNAAKGQYLIEGRIKEVIINESGENVYPDELEDSFLNLDGVSQYTIVGLPVKGSRYEDIALVINAGEKAGDENFIRKLTSDIRLINEDLPVYKRLTKVLVASDPLPVANGFKVKRIALRKMIEDGKFHARELELSAAQAENRKSDLEKKVCDIYSEVLNIPAGKIDRDANFIADLGGDSLQVLSIITKAEELFGVMIPAEEYGRCATINGAVELLSELVFGKGSDSGTRRQVLREAVSDFEDTREYKEFKARRAALTANGAHDPYFVVHDSPLLDTSVVDGKTYLDFGSYNYVGMSGRKEVSDAAKAAIDKYGTSASGSRLLAGEKPIHGELEKAIAEWKNAESALVLVGGHSTNVTVVGNFCGKNDLIVYDALAHNSIEQGCKLSDATARPFPHNDLDTLEQILSNQRRFFEKVLIVIEGVYSMDGDVSDVPAFVALKKKYGCFLMVDEAHSSCVLGEHGGGVDEYFHLDKNDIDIKYGTLSKGLGTCGGYIAGRKSLIDYFRYNLPGFVFSVGISPALAAGALESIRQLRDNPSIMASLHENIRFFAEEAKRRNLDICLGGKSAILPVLVGRDEDAVALSNELNARGILVPPAVYPAVPRNKARLRFDVISEHKKEQILFALDTLQQAAKDLNIKLPEREAR